MEEEPEAEAILATGNPAPSWSKEAEGTTEPIEHHSLKCQASGSFNIPSGKGKAFRRLSSTPIEDAVAFLVISEKAVTMTAISSGDLLIGKATKKSGEKGMQSIYRYQHCGYVTEWKAQGATHVNTWVTVYNVVSVITALSDQWTLNHIWPANTPEGHQNGLSCSLIFPA